MAERMQKRLERGQTVGWTEGLTIDAGGIEKTSPRPCAAPPTMIRISLNALAAFAVLAGLLSQAADQAAEDPRAGAYVRDIGEEAGVLGDIPEDEGIQLKKRPPPNRDSGTSRSPTPTPSTST
jgi:hypothetical protein